MKYFAKMGRKNNQEGNGKYVIGFTHVHDSEAPTEEAGRIVLHERYSYPFWKEYSKATPPTLRKNGVGIGYIYDEGRDAFIPPQPFPSWTLNEVTCNWVSPVPHPDTGGDRYIWNEETIAWDLVED